MTNGHQTVVVSHPAVSASVTASVTSASVAASSSVIPVASTSSSASPPGKSLK